MKPFIIDKIANAIIYFIDNNVYNLDVAKLINLLYFADKMYLESYGISLFNIEYTKYRQGLFALTVLNAISNRSDKMFYQLRKYVEVIKNKKGIVCFRKKKDFNKDFFANIAIKILTELSKKYKNCTAKKISKESHELEEYKKIPMDSKIRFSDMVSQKETKLYIDYWEKEYNSFERAMASE